MAQTDTFIKLIASGIRQGILVLTLKIHLAYAQTMSLISIFFFLCACSHDLYTGGTP